jgi:hypothetical protein
LEGVALPHAFAAIGVLGSPLPASPSAAICCNCHAVSPLKPG